MSADRPRAKYDEAYKLLFSSPVMVEGFLFHVLPDFAEHVDLSTLRKLSASFVKRGALRQRHADMLWRARLRTHGRHPVYLSLEFQSAPVSNIAPWLQIPEAGPGEAESEGRRKTMMRFEETWLAENLRKRDEELRQEGHEEGHQEGRRSLLRQLALQEFGPGGIAQLAEVLDERAGSDRDGALARAIIECDTVAEVIARARKLQGPASAQPRSQQPL